VIKRSHDDHSRIVGALSAGDAERADYLMREHVHFAGLVLLRRLEQSSAWEPRLRAAAAS
jgi:GntR family transcriptional regulator, vanillate catabolism transcriptional regulator